MIAFDKEVDAMEAYSMDFRQSVAAARQGGMSTAEVVEAFGCSASWVRRLLQQQRESGSLEPRQRQPVDQRKIKDAQRQQLQEFLREQPDATLAELIEALDLQVHPGTLCRTLHAMDLPLKKSPCTPASRTAPMSKKHATIGSNSFRT
jgi:transposase